ncbi:MAG TPA: carboxypeptidase-like regulatory domain-containing protein [Candidatus Acidoferrum sp.]|nr:carboxypeptidase-like regulatory domain-containing protein [Candidatus Acidoferrum sp.]
MPKPSDPMGLNATGDAQKTASISGTVLDSTGAAIPGAQVSLALKDGSRLESVKSGANGEFSLIEVPAGSYLVIVEAVGFAPFKTEEFMVATQQVYSLRTITLSVAEQTTSVVVRPTEVIAAEQIKTEEKQRVLGIVPNFYVSFTPDAAPLTSKQKFSLSAHDAFDWASFAAVSVGAGAEQATNAFKGYGQGAAGYGKRWGALFASARSNDLLSHYVFASLFHQDPRYFYQGTGTKKSRLLHALSYAFVARGDNGKNMPNYTYILADICSGALSNAYYPPANRGAGLVFTNAAIALAARAGQGVLEEFIGKRFTKNAPDSGSSEKMRRNESPSARP